MSNFRENANFIWGVADLIRDSFKRGKYQDVILPLTVLRRIDCVLEPTKAKVFEVNKDLIRRFNEALDENPGEHFTPREVIRLMANLLLSRDREALARNHIIRTVYDPCCGSGGMLTIAKERISQINPKADVFLFGQEVNPETWAVSKADLLMTSADGRDADNIKFGSTLSKDQLAGQPFDYLLTNPPYGKDWKADEEAVRTEAEKGYAGRFGAGLPRISDGQLLFLQHMLGRMKDAKEGGSRVAIVMNGSPLFSGDAGSGESEIRRWVLESDWLEAIVALPEQLFYNTGIGTYVWILTNRKEKKRRGKVQLINATSFWVPMRRSLGDKRREISDDQISQLTTIFEGFEEGEHSNVYPTEFFGYRKITVERPLPLNFQASPERIERLKTERAFQALAESKKKKAREKEAEEAEGRKQQEAVLKMLSSIPSKPLKNRNEFLLALDSAMKSAGIKLSAPLRKAVLSALSERDETAEICRDDEGNPEPDPDLRDNENVPLNESVAAFFDREVKPHVPDAWINRAILDHKDGQVGKVGYEINFNRYFYKYQPPRPLEEIEADIKTIEKDILSMLRDVAG